MKIFMLPLGRFVGQIVLLNLAFGLTYRSVAATLTVSNLNASGPGSLRQTIIDSSAGDTINFAVTGTIPQTARSIIATNLTISGPGPQNLTVIGSSNGAFAVTGGTVVLSGMSIIGGSQQFEGGGIANYGGTVAISNCTFLSNSATGLNGGGGIYNGQSGILTVENCTFAFNFGRSGGALANYSIATVKNSTISSNTAGLGDAGGIWNSGILILDHCTVCSNSVLVSQGGGVRNAGSGLTYIGNSIVAGNLATTQVTPKSSDVFGDFISNGYNLIAVTNESTGITNGVNHDQAGRIGNPLDPKLGPLQDNSGPTWTHALRFDSTAVDAGHSGGLTTDQRAVARPLLTSTNTSPGDGSDIGAYELDPELRITAIERADTNVWVKFTSVFGKTNRLDSKTNLNDSWSTFATNIPGTGGILQVTHTNATSQPQRFYQAVRLP